MDELRTLENLLQALDRLRVRAARGTGKSKISLRDLEAATGVPRSSLSGYFTGATPMPVDVLDAVVLALGADAVETKQWATAFERITQPARPAGLRQLPGTVAGFTGREDELSELDGLLKSRLILIAGTAGVGKTTLAVQWAHRIAGQFPDGQLYLNLHGYDPVEPMSAEAAIDRLLRELNVQSIPADPDERVNHYRSVLAERRVLLVLDNARSAEQVRPLLPGGQGNLVLLTSRESLQGLVARDGIQRVTLERLTEPESAALLGRLLSAGRMTPEQVGEVARLCAGLPLALRLAAERIARERSADTDLLADLRTEALDLLSVDGDPLADVRAVFSWSYRALPADAAELFSLLGQIPGADFGAYAAASIAAIPVAKARRLLDTLERAHLLEARGNGRYGMHDLLRAYAAELEPDPRPAQERLLDWYLHTANAAMDLIHPHRPESEPRRRTIGPMFAGTAEAFAWLDAERHNLVAATADRSPYAWRIARALWRFFALRGHVDDWYETHHRALAMAREFSEPEAEGQILHSLGAVQRATGKYVEAIVSYEKALLLRNQSGQASTLSQLGVVYDHLGHLDRAIDCHREALLLAELTSDRWSEAGALLNLAITSRKTTRFNEGHDYGQRALARYRELGEAQGEAMALNLIGQVKHSLGQHDAALAALRSSLEIAERIDSPLGVHSVLQNLGQVHISLRDYDTARDCGLRALTIARDLHDPEGEARVLSTLGVIHVKLGDFASALDHQQRALALCANPDLESTIRNDLGLTYHKLGNVAASREQHALALALATRTGNAYERHRAQVHRGQMLKTPGRS